nr:plectin-like isoform X2 [Setaria viridis]
MPPEQLLPRDASAGGGDRAEAGEVVMVRRSAVVPCVTCGLCGRILRDATTVSECLHSFCRKCVFKKFKDEDTTFCPTCSTDLGCDPLEKLRTDHSLLCLRLMLFPVKRRKVEEISLLHPASVSLPFHLPQIHGVGQSGKKTDAFFMGESMNGEAEAEAAESLGMELTASPMKSSMCSRSTPAEEVGTFIVTVEKERRARAATEPTLSSEVQIAVEGSAALPPAASQRETHENTARTLEEVEFYIGRNQSLQSENARLREELEKERAEKTVAVETRRILEAERLQRESDVTQSTARMLEMIQACTGQNQALGVTNARLREELETEKVAAFDRARILEGRLQTESEIRQKMEAVQGLVDSLIAAQRLLIQDYQALKSEISEKNEEHATLLYDINVLETEKTCLEYQVDYLTKSLAERTARISERFDTYLRRSQASEAENARLREELDNERAKRAFDRTRALEARLRRESEIAQSIEAALSQLNKGLPGS